MCGILRRHRRSGRNMRLDLMRSNFFHSTLSVKNILHDFNSEGLQHER
jgi:hypothetical protein